MRIMLGLFGHKTRNHPLGKKGYYIRKDPTNPRKFNVERFGKVVQSFTNREQAVAARDRLNRKTLMEHVKGIFKSKKK